MKKKNTKLILIIVLALLIIAGVIFISSHYRIINKSPNICDKDNSCKLRTPGSGFRCDGAGKYVEDGDKWCECTASCKVKIK
jgi:hypothetical protein